MTYQEIEGMGPLSALANCVLPLGNACDVLEARWTRVRDTVAEDQSKDADADVTAAVDYARSLVMQLNGYLGRCRQHNKELPIGHHFRRDVEGARECAFRLVQWIAGPYPLRMSGFSIDITALSGEICALYLWTCYTHVSVMRLMGQEKASGSVKSE